MYGLFFAGSSAKTWPYLLDSRVYTWQEDLRWFAWFGVHWIDMNRMNISAFGILYSDCISNDGFFSRNSQTFIIDPFFGTTLLNGGSQGDDLPFMDFALSWNYRVFPSNSRSIRWVPLDESWGWHEHQMHLRRSLRLAWSSRIHFRDSIFQTWWCLMYPPQETNISHLGKRKIIDPKVPLGGDMFVPRRVIVSD